jgi:hypothetical protein
MLDHFAKIEAFNKKMAKSKEFPSAIKLEVGTDGKSVQAELLKGAKENFRQFDPWTLAFVHEAEEILQVKILRLTFLVKNSIFETEHCQFYFEAFKRRVSFLNMNNTVFALICTILLDGKEDKLYTEKELFNRPANEVIRTDPIKERSDNKSTHLEKVFQTFLYGEGIPVKTNDRLALLGDHFLNVKGKNLHILREYPTGVFNKQASEKNRVLMTDFVDIVSINKSGCLSVIELKIDNNSPLELISQVLDYALFFACYVGQLLKTNTLKPLAANIRKNEISCYAVANYFHKRLDSILPYYRTSGRYNFELYKVLLGNTTKV